ncbi:class I SAM-dependent methyltransferase [bacterium]|nr:class I SAM-dependent methyltransferase [bacterium]
MRFKKDFLYSYLKEAPASLAIERSLECEIFSKQEFTPPILDIGCGDGLFAFILFDEKIDVGIEPNGRELGKAEEYGMYKELIQCYGNDVLKKSESFNTIFSNSVLEHIPEFQPVLNEAHRLLTPEGKFYVTVPTDMFDKYSILYQLLSLFKLNNLAERYRKFFNKFWKHFNCHKKEDWEKIFRDSGFEVIDSKEYDSKSICLINDFLAPFAFLSFIMKRMTGRWIMSPNLRKIYIYPFYLIAKGLIRRYESGNTGGIIFFSLKKKYQSG